MSSRSHELQQRLIQELPDKNRLEILKELTASNQISCPECGCEMLIRLGHKYAYNNGQPRPFYGCSKWPDCNGTHGAHPNGKPLGIPADNATKKLRQQAHRAFDTLWKKHNLSRPESYKVLQRIMRMSKEEAHIGRFNAEQCQRLISSLEDSELIAIAFTQNNAS